MGLFRKASDVVARTSLAIAYLKVTVPDDAGATVIELSPEDSPVMKSLGGELLVAYVVDTGNAFDYVQYRDLKTGFVTESQLHQNALQNLANRAEMGNLRVAPVGQIFAVLLDGNFEASLILVDRLWDETFRQFVQGDYLVAIPSRDILAFCDSSSAAGRTKLLEIVDRVKESPDHPLTPHLYVRRDKMWVREKAL